MRLPLLLIFFSLSSAFAQDLSLFKERIDTLASPTMGGRGYTNREDTLAAAYLIDEYKRIGLIAPEDGYLQSFPITVNTFPNALSLTLDEKALTPGIDFIANPASGKGSGTYKVFYPHTKKGEKLLLKNKHTNRIAIVHDTTIHRWENEEAMGIMKLKKLSFSKAVLRVKTHQLTASYAHTQTFNPSFELKSGDYSGIKNVSLNIDAEIWTGNSQNVVGFIKGNNTDSTVIISGHYDHLGRMGPIYFPGANDNASGIAMLLALADYFQKNDSLLRYNLMFIAFSGEEAGLIGSKYFVEHPLVPLTSIKAQITLDLFGAGTKGMTVVNAPANPYLYEKLKEVNQYLPEIKSRKQAANSDHYFFDKAGVPSIFLYTLGDLTAYHDVNDTPEKLEYGAYDDVFNLLKDFVLKIQ